MSTPSPSNLPNEQATPPFPWVGNNGFQYATILENSDNALEIGKNADGTYSLITHYPSGRHDGFDDVTVRITPKHLDMLALLAPSLAATQAQIAKLTEERDEARKNADYNWGAANYRLKYLDHVGAALGRPHANGEDCAKYASDCWEIATALRAQVADLTRSLEAKQQVLDAATRQVSTIEDFLWGRQYCTELYISPLGFNGNEAWQVELNWGDGTQAFQGASVAEALASAMVEAMERKAKRATQPAQSTAQGTEVPEGTIRAVTITRPEVHPVHRITETNQPTFPCWLWGANTKEWHWFIRDESGLTLKADKAWLFFCTSKDRPTATPPESKEGGL